MIAVFGGSLAAPGEAAYDEAVRAGALLAAAGFAVATGGYGGVMEAAARGAVDRGGEAIGYTAPAVFPNRAGPNSHITAEVATETISGRINRLVEGASGFLVLPGSIGTLTELMVAWNTAFVARFSGKEAKPVATVGEPWRSLIPHLTDVLDTDGSLVTSHADVEAAVAYLTSRLA